MPGPIALLGFAASFVADSMADAAIAGGALLAEGAASLSVGGTVAAKLYKGPLPRETEGSLAGAVVALGSLAARSSSLASSGERSCTVCPPTVSSFFGAAAAGLADADGLSESDPARKGACGFANERRQ